MPGQVKRRNKTYERMETSCRTTNRRVPCTYPSCPRNVNLQKNAVRSFGKT